MQTGAAQFTIFSLLLVIRPWQAPAVPNEAAMMPHVGVLVRNLSEVPADTVQKAEAACEQMFRAASIRVAWINAVDDVSWQGPDIVLRGAIVPRAPVSRGMDVFDRSPTQERWNPVVHLL